MTPKRSPLRSSLLHYPPKEKKRERKSGEKIQFSALARSFHSSETVNPLVFFVGIHSYLNPLPFDRLYSLISDRNGEEPSLQSYAEVEGGFGLRRPGGGRRRNEWHAARLASLNTSHTVTWEEFKKKQKEDELKRGELEADKDRMMREYRAQLDAERAHKLSLGRNHSVSKSHHKKEKKDKDMKKRSSKKRKHKRRSSESSSSSSSSESSSSDGEERESRRSRSKSRSKQSKKERKHRSRANHSSSHGESDGPLPLSSFFGSVKS